MNAVAVLFVLRFVFVNVARWTSAADFDGAHDERLSRAGQPTGLGEPPDTLIVTRGRR